MADELAAKIVKKFEELGDDDEFGRLFTAATVIIRHFLGDAFMTNRVRLSKNPDPFMLNKFDDTSVSRLIHMQRILSLADYLFTLKDVDGFGVVVERFLTRDTRSPFFEARAASLFVDDGFKVVVKRETGVKRQDFDFTAKRENHTVNVEVTACTNASFSKKNVENVLQGKRKQLPDTNPAALYCTLPANWFGEESDLPLRLVEITNSFFATSRRINWVVYMWDHVVRVGEGAATAIVTHPFVHSNPRLPFANPSFLFEDDEHLSEIVRALDSRDAKSLQGFANILSFSELVKSLTA